MNLQKYTGGNSNFIIWVLLFVLILGFGKGRETLGINLIKQDRCDERKGRKGRKDDFSYANKGYGGVGGLFGGNAAVGSPLGGNIVFILIIIAILFLSKDKKEGAGYGAEVCNEEEEVNEYQ